MRTTVAITGLLLVLTVQLGCESAGPAKTKVQAEPEVVMEPTPQLDPTTYFAHGLLLERQKQFERAITQYRQALEIDPTYVNARNHLGMVLNQLDRHSEATAEFQLAVQQQPDSAQLYNNLGFSLYLQKQYRDAIESFSRSLDIAPGFGRAHMNLGLAYGKLGEFDVALEHFRNAVPEADAYYNIAVMQTTAGNYAEAANSLEQAIAARPEFPEARQHLREIARKTAEAETKQQLAAGNTQPESAAIAAADSEPVIESSSSTDTATPNDSFISAENTSSADNSNPEMLQ
jgi:tetratricopeptide (TPR) repeat protein